MTVHQRIWPSKKKVGFYVLIWDCGGVWFGLVAGARVWFEVMRTP